MAHIIVNDILNNFNLKQIKVISGTNVSNEDEKYYIDRYKPSKFIFYKEYNMNDILFTMEYQNAYSKAMVDDCLDGKDKMIIKYTNPDEAKQFIYDNNQTVWQDVFLSVLPKPTHIGKDAQTAFTYIIVYDENTKQYHIRFGQVNNLSEIGVKHSILAGNDGILVSGELAIRKNSIDDYEYIFNIISSKMQFHKEFTEKILQRYNKRETATESQKLNLSVFYYILLYNLSYFLLTSLHNEVYTLRPIYGVSISYDTEIENVTGIYSPQKLKNQCEKIFPYYYKNLCPSPDYIR
jgi:hypothetical protein